MTAAPLSAPEHPPLYRCALASLAEPQTEAMPQGEEARWLSELASESGRCDWNGWLHQPPAADAALHRLARHYALQPAECVAIALACAVETDPMAGRVLSWLQAPTGGARPMIGLLMSLCERLGLPDGLSALADGTARRIGLLQVDQDERRPLPEQALWVPLPIVLALRAAAGKSTRQPRAGRPLAS
ncbi:MAG: hypothetical protein RJA44_2557, partial [Pseudomonadota bacterium]